MLHGTTTLLKGTPIKSSRESFFLKKISAARTYLKLVLIISPNMNGQISMVSSSICENGSMLINAIKVTILPMVFMPMEQPQMVQPLASGLCSTTSKDTRVDRCDLI